MRAPYTSLFLGFLIAACGSRTALWESDLPGAVGPSTDGAAGPTDGSATDVALGVADVARADAAVSADGDDADAAVGADAAADAGAPVDSSDDAPSAPDAPTDTGLSPVDATPDDATQDGEGTQDGEVSSSLCAPVAGLLAYYPLDTDLLDHSGNGHDAIGNDVALIAAGKVGGAAAFNGDSSYLEATGSAALPSARTFCAWVNEDPRTGLGQPLFSAGVAAKGDFFSIAASDPLGGTCTFLPPNAPFVDHWGTPCYEAGTLGVSTGGWNLVCFADDGAGFLTFYSGQESGAAAGSEYAYSFDTLFFGSAVIGGTTTQSALLGALDEVTVWSGALSATDVAALWNDGNGCSVR